MVAPETRSRQGRIPSTLQAVFLASNRGREVNRPPPDQVAHKVFFRNVFAKLRGGSGKRFRSAEKQVKRSKSPARAPVEIVEVKKAEPVRNVSPQAFLDVMLSTSGYSTMRTKTLNTAYHNRPTELQQASYDVHLIKLVRTRDVEAFREMMSSGISSNPCNSFGESLIHLVCRRGDVELLQIMLDNGADVQVVDDYGRTPLHDACWAAKPCFDVVEMILNIDKTLFHMTDQRGSVPLSYVHRDHWAEWIQWLETKKHVYWPARVPMRDGPERVNPLLEQAPNTRPVPSPKNALTVELAKMVVSGRITPGEAKFLNVDEDNITEDYSDFDSDSESDCSDSECSDDDALGSGDDDDDDDSAFMEEDELADMFQRLSSASPATN